MVVNQTRSALLIGEENIRVLNQKKVMVIGLGGVGGFATEALVRSGIGGLVLVDFDTIEASNLNRQIIATYDNLGQTKVDAFIQRIHSINKDCDVIGCNQKFAVELLDQYPVDYVLDCMDDVKAKVALMGYCQDHHILELSIMGTARKTDPMALGVTKLSNTQQDPLAKQVRIACRNAGIPLKTKVIYSTQPATSVVGGQPLPSMIFVPGMAGLLAANVCVKDLIHQAMGHCIAPVDEATLKMRDLED